MATYELVLPETQLRHWLDDKVSQAHDEFYYSYGVRPEMIERANVIANSIAGLFEIELLEPSNYGQDYYNRCDNYVFSRVLEETWHDPKSVSAESVDLWFNSIRFFLGKGFMPIDQEGEPGDVVMYATEHGNSAHHFGIYKGNGAVDSKFGMGPLLRHAIDLVPAAYGDTCIFLRKQEMSAEKTAK